MASHGSLSSLNSSHGSSHGFSHGAVKRLVRGGEEVLSCHDLMRSDSSFSALAVATWPFVLESGPVLESQIYLGEFVKFCQIFSEVQ